MKNIPWPMVGIVFVLTAVIVAARTGFTGALFLTAALASLATVIGALCAPATFSPPRPDRAEARSRKSIQLTAAGLVTAGIVWLFGTNAGVAAIGGIVAAMMVGAVWPRTASPEQVDA